MATRTASIEKVVRKVLDEELEQRNEAMLEAIEQMNRVLTEEQMKRCVLNGVAFGVWHFEPLGEIDFSEFIEEWVQAQIDAMVQQMD